MGPQTWPSQADRDSRLEFLREQLGELPKSDPAGSLLVENRADRRRRERAERQTPR